MRVLMSLFMVLALTACGTTRYGNGKFEDPNEINLMADNFSESHMMDFASESVKQLLGECAVINKDPNSPPPYVAFGQVRNDTEEMINMDMMTDRVKSELLRSGKVRFISVASREALDNEYAYSESGAVSAGHKKSRGKQIAPDYLFVGKMAGIEQNGGKTKTKYYQFTATLVDIETSAEVCSIMRDNRTRYKKGRY